MSMMIMRDKKRSSAKLLFNMYDNKHKTNLDEHPIIRISHNL